MSDVTITGTSLAPVSYAPTTHRTDLLEQEQASVAALPPHQAYAQQVYANGAVEGIRGLREMPGLPSLGFDLTQLRHILNGSRTLTRDEIDQVMGSKGAATHAAKLWKLLPPDGYMPSDMSFEQALGVLDQHFAALDRDGDGRFSLSALSRVARDPNADPQLRAAAQALIANPHFLNALDVAGGENQVDKMFSRQGLDAALAAERFAPNDMLTPEEVARVLDANGQFDLLDKNRDRQLSRDELREALFDESVPERTRQALMALLFNDNTFAALDVGRGGEANGTISRNAVDDVAWGPTQPSDNVWSLFDDLALDRALRNEGTFGNELFTAFDQGKRGNCASIAVVKAAMDKYGNDVFQQVQRTEGGGYRVTMQDGVVVELTRDELQAAARASDFEGQDQEACAYATLCFAAMAKRAQTEGHEGCETYAEALWTLTTGEQTRNVPRWLGLQDKVRDIPRDEVGDYSSGVVGYGNGHAVYIDTVDGQTYVDLWKRDHDGLIPLDELAANTTWEGPERYFVFI